MEKEIPNSSEKLPLRLLTGKDVAHILKINSSQAYKIMRRGELPAVNIGRSIRVKPEDLDTFYCQEHNLIWGFPMATTININYFSSLGEKNKSKEVCMLGKVRVGFHISFTKVQLENWGYGLDKTSKGQEIETNDTSLGVSAGSCTTVTMNRFTSILYKCFTTNCHFRKYILEIM